MAENYRKGDRTDWHSNRMTAEPEINKRPTGDESDRVGSQDAHDNPHEQR